MDYMDAFNEDIGRLLKDPNTVSDADVESRLNYVPRRDVPDAKRPALSKLPVFEIGIPTDDTEEARNTAKGKGHADAITYFRDLLRITKNSDDYNPGEVTHLLSFGARDEKFPFSKVQDLARRLGSSTYVDSERLPDMPGSYRLTGDGEDGKSYNVFWQEYYGAAMDRAKVMTFIITKAWKDSPNCWEELEWATTRRSNRANLIVFQDQATRNALKGGVNSVIEDSAGNRHVWRDTISTFRHDVVFATKIDDIKQAIDLALDQAQLASENERETPRRYDLGPALYQAGVRGAVLTATTKALELDGATSIAALESAPLDPDVYPNTHKMLVGNVPGVSVTPVEKAMVEQSLTKMGRSSNTPGAHTGTGSDADAAQSAKALQKLGELKAMQDAFQPFIDKATSGQAEAEGDQEAIGKKAVANARAELLVVHGLELPAEISADGASKYLDREIGKLRLAAVPSRPDMSVADLVERNELMHCVHLHRTGADIAPNPVGQLKRGKTPFKNPRGPSYRLIDRDVETTRRHATMSQIDEAVGASFSAAASTKGAAFLGPGVGAWSASVSASAAAEAKRSTGGTNSEQMTTHVKVKQATLICTQFSLAGRDWELTPEFEGRLAELYHEDGREFAVAATVRNLLPSEAQLYWGYSRSELTTTVPKDGKGAVDAQVLQFLDDYGSHLATQAVLGGRYKIECRLTARESELSGSRNTAVAAALEFHASAAAAYAGFGGAGTAGASAAGSAHALRQGLLQTAGEDHHRATTMSMVVTGGVPGDMAAWLNDLRQSNRGWEVVERMPHRGLCPIWDLVRKSKRLSPEEQNSVSDRIKACFDKEVAWELASRAFVVGYNKKTGGTNFEEILPGEDGKLQLQYTMHHNMERKRRLPTDLGDFVSFVIGDRTFVKVVDAGFGGDYTYEIDFTNKEMNLVDECLSNGHTSAVAFTKDDRAFVVHYVDHTGKAYFSEYWIGEEGKLQRNTYPDSGQLPTGLTVFVSFNVGDRTYVGASFSAAASTNKGAAFLGVGVGAWSASDSASAAAVHFEVDFTSEKMKLNQLPIDKSPVSSGKNPVAHRVWTSAVAFAKGNSAWVVGYNKEANNTGPGDENTYLQELWIDDDEQLRNYVYWPAELPKGLVAFVSFVIGDRTFVTAVGKHTKLIYEIDFTNKEMNLVRDRGSGLEDYTSAVAFASPKV